MTTTTEAISLSLHASQAPSPTSRPHTRARSRAAAAAAAAAAAPTSRPTPTPTPTPIPTACPAQYSNQTPTQAPPTQTDFFPRNPSRLSSESQGWGSSSQQPVPSVAMSSANPFASPPRTKQAEPDLGFESASVSSDQSSNLDESCKRSVGQFPCPSIWFPSPTLDFDFRLAVKLRPEPARVQTRAPSTNPTPPNPTAAPCKEIVAVSGGQWSGTFGSGRVMAGGYDLGQARGFRPVRVVESAFVLQTSDDPPGTLELRTRGSLSGPCDVLDTLLSCGRPRDVDPRKYVFRMFATIKSTDKRYVEFVNCALWIASGVWKGDELLIDAYRVT